MTETEIDPLDTEKVLTEADQLVECTTSETALDAYFSMLGNCPKVDQKTQITKAAEYHAEVRLCQDILNKMPGKVTCLHKILEEIEGGERLENFVVSDKEIRRHEYFEALSQAEAIKNPDLSRWRIRPTLLLTWTRQILEAYRNLPQRPMMYKITPIGHQAAESLIRWVAAVERLEELLLLPINEIAFYCEGLQTHAAQSEKIFCTLVEANLKLVVAMAKRYQNRGLDMNDLIQEGNLGLMKGIERYQAHKGFNVSTYVVWWIRQSIAKALMTQGYVIRYPPSVHELLRKANKLMEEARGNGQPEPTVHEMAKQLNTSPENVDAALHMFSVVSLNQTTGDGDETLENVIPSTEGITFRESEERREALEILMQCLSPSERRVLNLWLGLSNGIGQAINDISTTLNISREKVRQTLVKAKKKMKNQHRVQVQKVKLRH
jgi:RNA polymerase sigma factor (sigma-70 family)